VAVVAVVAGRVILAQLNLQQVAAAAVMFPQHLQL
jgi:hypothetical protein